MLSHSILITSGLDTRFCVIPGYSTTLLKARDVSGQPTSQIHRDKILSDILFGHGIQIKDKVTDVKTLPSQVLLTYSLGRSKILETGSLRVSI